MDGNTEKTGSLTARALWIMCAKALAFAFSFALPLLLVRHLGQHEFGLYKQVFLVVGTAVGVLPLGFVMSAFYFLPREPERGRAIVFNILIFYALVGVLAWLALALNPGLLAAVFRSEEIAAYSSQVGLVIMLWAVASSMEFIAIANQETRLASVLIVVSQLTKTGSLLAAALLFGTVRSLVYAAVLQGVLQTVVLLAYLSVRFRGFWRCFEWGAMRRQLAYALPLGLGGIFYTVQMDFHNYTVSYHFDAAAFAVYSIGCFQLPFVSIISEAVGSVMIPRVSYLQKTDDRREIVGLIARMARKQAFVFLPLYVLLLIAGREFIVVLFTRQYEASWPIFAVNLTFVPLAIIASACDPVTRAYSEHRTFPLRVRTVLVPLLAVALWFGTARYGLLGAITIMVGFNVVERLVLALKVGAILGVGRRDLALLRDVGKIAAASVAAGAVAWPARALALATTGQPFAALVVCGAVFTLVYLSAVLLLGVLSPEERAALRRALTRFALRRPAGPEAGGAVSTPEVRT